MGKLYAMKSGFHTVADLPASAHSWRILMNARGDLVAVSKGHAPIAIRNGQLVGLAVTHDDGAVQRFKAGGRNGGRESIN